MPVRGTRKQVSFDIGLFEYSLLQKVSDACDISKSQIIKSVISHVMPTVIEMLDIEKNFPEMSNEPPDVQKEFQKFLLESILSEYLTLAGFEIADRWKQRVNAQTTLLNKESY